MEERPSNEVVSARDQLALHGAADLCARDEARPDRDFALPLQYRIDERAQGVESSGKVDVHIGDHVCSAGQPSLFERPSSTSLVQPEDRYARVLRCQATGELEGAISAPVVGDD